MIGCNSLLGDLLAWCYMSRNEKPSYALADVAALASDPDTFQLQPNPRLDVANYGLDDEDVRDWFADIIHNVTVGNAAFIKSRRTVKFPPGTMSDYYRADVPGLGRAFIKFAVYRGRLIVTSFKEDDDVA